MTAVLHSETARSRVAHMQSGGQWGTRYFNKLMFELHAPLSNVNDPLHRKLTAAQRAASVAATAPLKESTYFVTARKHIHAALQDDGIAQEIEELVTRLLAES